MEGVHQKLSPCSSPYFSRPMNTHLGLAKIWIAIILGFIVFTPEAQSSRIAGRAQIVCSPLQGASVIAHCTVTNASKDPILILNQPLTAEGKLPGKGYFPIPSGGERSENVFEYVAQNEAWPGILGEPVRHLHPDALRSLILLAPGSKASFQVEWQEAQEVVSSLKGLRASPDSALGGANLSGDKRRCPLTL